METHRDLLNKLRSRIDSAHRDAVIALDCVARYLEENPENKEVSSNGKAGLIRGFKPGSQRETIAQSLTEFLSVPEIAEQTGLTESEIRGALYAKDFRRKIEKRRIDKKVKFRTKRQG
ncbi:MAG: hypothetical protein IID35_04350 [Planctomycetes bacterium]|nr:hypothetical protein [Planctomycetota bacterium]